MTSQRTRQIFKSGWDLVTGTSAKRYDAWHLLMSFIVRKSGGRTYNPYVSWFRDKTYAPFWADFPVKQEVPAERKYTLIQLAKAVRGIPGDTAECGVLEGASSYIILNVNEGTGKMHHIFDSFEGLSEPDREDVVGDKSVYSWSQGDLSVAEDIVKQNLSKFSNMQLYKGWIPDRFSDVSDKIFSLVHIDVDLYQPTLDSLSFFYERLSPGGMIVCDDYGSRACPGALRALDEWMEDKPEHVIHLTTGQGLIIKNPV